MDWFFFGFDMFWVFFLTVVAIILIIILFRIGFWQKTFDESQLERYFRFKQ